MALSATLSGELKVVPIPGSITSSSLLLQFGLAATNGAPVLENSQQQAQVASPSAFVALPITANILGKTFVLHMAGSTTFLVRVTYATTGQISIPTVGLLILEAPVADEITGVDVQGTGTFSWALIGGKV